MINAKSITFLVLGGIFFGCQQSPESGGDLRKQLLVLHSTAEAGTSAQAAKAGEESLQLIDFQGIRDSISLVQTGEKSFTFDAFDAGMQLFEMAKRKNPANFRVDAYLALLRPLKYLKGYIWRLSLQDNLSIFRAIHDSRSMFGDPKWEEMGRFFLDPYENKFDSYNQAVREIATPLSAELLKSAKVWKNLAERNLLDISMQVPAAIFGITNFRLRKADARYLESLSLGHSLYYRLISLYDFGSMSPQEWATKYVNSNDQTQWLALSKDPRFGILLDREFHSSFKENTMAIVRGVDLLLDLLEDREKKGENDAKDLIQVKNLNSNDGDKNESIISMNRGSSQYLLSQVKKDLAQIKQAIVGPIQLQARCAIHIQGKPTTFRSEKYWADLPTYLLNPSLDLKNEDPIFGARGQLRDFKDTTFRGLFPQGLPCKSVHE